MNRIATALFTLSVLLMTTNGSATTPQSVEVTRNLTSMPLAFTENQGQWDEQVLYRANAGGATMWFTKDGAVYHFTRQVAGAREARESRLDRVTLSGVEGRHQQPDSIESIAIKASFVGANPNPQMVAIDAMEYKCNYFIGNDPNEWHTDVPNYNAIVYEEIYSGIDLKYYGNGKQMEYDFIVSPGADFSQIKTQYEGAESISVNDNGELVVETIWGEVVEQRPVIYQIENDRRIPVEGIYKLQGDNSFGFELNNYNPDLPLIIDPVLIYSTYLGGVSGDFGYSITVDASGAAYVAGFTWSEDFPVVNPYQGTFQGSWWSAFVTKLSNSGNSLVYSTYIGGTSFDFGVDITVDASGAAYITGSTGSTDFPTLNPYQGTFRGGYSDIFVTMLSNSGNSLVYSTYLGGTGREEGYSIVVDASGTAYVTGYTNSTDFPTLNPYQGTFQGGTWGDAFVTKLSSSGNSLIYSTYLGGGDSDEGYSIAADASGAVYVTGYTNSTDFPTLNPYQGIYQGGDHDAFVTKLSSSGNNLIYSTYLGGVCSDYSMDISVDDSGAACVTGSTGSTDFPTLNPYQGTFQGGDHDAFITKLSIPGSGLVYSTYLGGSNSDEGYSITVDDSGTAYITGSTGSTDFPTLNPFQGTYQGGAWDAFVTKLSISGNSLVYSTYLGGSSNGFDGPGDDFGYGIAIDTSGATYITGYTESIDFPKLNFPYQGTFQGSGDAFVTKLSEDCCLPPIRGNVDYDALDQIDISDLVYMVDYMFNGGPPPPCPDEADINGEGGIDISDLVHIVDYMFTGGPPPVACP